MLERYSWRHDSIWHIISSSMKTSDNVGLFVGLPTHIVAILSISIVVLVTLLFSNIVILNRCKKPLVIFELSAPFEMNILSTNKRKIERYQKRNIYIYIYIYIWH